jgi:D-lactate dehydrogenase
MPLCFVETEESEREFFAEELRDLEPIFVDELADVPAETEILSNFIYAAITKQFLESHPALRLIATRSTGIDHIAVAECESRGVAVSNVRSYGENTVAEHTFALILALSRRIREALQANVRRDFSYEAIRGFDLKGKTLGIIGSGRIGLHVARIASGFGMRVLAYDISPQPFLGEILGFDYVSCDEILQRSDIITLHTPLIESTYHLLDRAAFAKCKPGVLIINTARGRLIETAALAEALDSGVVGGAGLDVIEDERVFRKRFSQIVADQITDHLHSIAPPQELSRAHPERTHELQELLTQDDLLTRPNVIFTPHIAFNSREAVERINHTTVENIRGFLAGSPANLVTSSVRAR